MQTRSEAHAFYRQALKDCADDKERASTVKLLAMKDLFYLLVFVLRRRDLDKDWLFDRCRDVQRSPDGHMDLWAREHYKSTIITFGMTIQDILNDPEVTVGIFSHSRPIAKGFLRQIMREFTENERLKSLFPEVLWGDPKKQAPKWSEDDGIIVRRKSNPNASTVEAWGLVDGQPTSKHYTRLIYDDVVTISSVTTPEMMKKTTDAFRLSLNLGAQGGTRRIIGTRYHFSDTYGALMEQGSAEVRFHPATDDGTMTGKPVLLTASELAEKRRDMGPYIFACQMLQDPKADSAMGFLEQWVSVWPAHNAENLNVYLVFDPASGKKKGSGDYTAGWAVGYGADEHYYVLDIMRDRLNPTERIDLVFEWHRRWKPLAVGYEEYGMQADIHFIRERMKSMNYRFTLVPLGGQLSKVDRILRLVPTFEDGKMILPETLWYTTKEHEMQDMTQTFLKQEYLPFPVASHDDMLDSLSRIHDLSMLAPGGSGAAGNQQADTEDSAW
jgi:predicted phage terminase large subunit-like protein